MPVSLALLNTRLEFGGGMQWSTCPGHHQTPPGCQQRTDPDVGV